MKIEHEILEIKRKSLGDKLTLWFVLYYLVVIRAVGAFFDAGVFFLVAHLNADHWVHV